MNEFFQELTFWILIAGGILLIVKGTTPLLKVASGAAPLPAGLKEAIAA